MSEWSLTALVALEALGLFVVTPLSATRDIPSSIEIALGVAIIGVVLIIVWRSRGATVAVFVATAVELIATVLRAAHPSKQMVLLDFVAALIFFVALTVVLTIVVFGSGRITIHRIQGAIAIYLNLALAFALAFRLIDGSNPNAFALHSSGQHQSIFAFVYFSFETLTTSGYGDIVPLDPFARSLANLESVVGQLYPATVLARLVTLELEDRRRA